MRCNKTLEVLAITLSACASCAASAPAAHHTSIWKIMTRSRINPQWLVGEINKEDHDPSLKVGNPQVVARRQEELGAWNLTRDWIACPPPLIPNVRQLTSKWCGGPCCLPCPASLLFYKPKKLENIYTVKCVFDTISMVSCALLAICYCILPRRRKHPQSILLWYAITIVPRSGFSSIWLYEKADLLCKNVYETATMSNNWICGLQGILLVYTFQVGLCISFLLIANLHFLAAYRSELIQVHLTKLFVVSFLLPLCVIIPVAVKRDIEYRGIGSICLLSPEISAPYFNYPVSVIICIATLLHLGTIAFAIKVKAYAMHSLQPDGGSSPSSRRGSHSTTSTHRQRLHAAHEISLVFQQQWRAGLFAMCMVAFYLNYWLFLLSQPRKIQNLGPNLPWFMDWIHCLRQQASQQARSADRTTSPFEVDRQAIGDVAQAACASIAAPHVPDVSWLTVTEFSRALEGFIFFITFASKSDFRHDLRAKLLGNRDAIGPDMESTRGSRFDHHKHLHYQQYRAHPYSQENLENEPYTENLSVEDLNSIGEVPAPLPEAAHRHGRLRNLGLGFSRHDLGGLPSPYIDTIAAAVPTAGRSEEGFFARIDNKHEPRRYGSHDGQLQAARASEGLDSQPMARSQSALTHTPKIAWDIIPSGSVRKNSSNSVDIASTIGMNNVEALHSDGDMLITHALASNRPPFPRCSSSGSHTETLPEKNSVQILHHEVIPFQPSSLQPPPSQPPPPLPTRSDCRPLRDAEHK